MVTIEMVRLLHVHLHSIRQRFASAMEDARMGKNGKDESSKRGAEFTPGDHVAWNTSQGETTGVVKKRLTQRTRIEDHDVAAAPDNPEYLVVSDKSGAEAAHRPDALRKTRK